MEQVHRLHESTLAELRQVVAESEGMPGEARVLARTKPGLSSDGAKLTRLHIAGPDGNRRP